MTRPEDAHVRFGVVLGRFQPLHLGHVEYLEAARARCEELVIGITNPEIDVLVHDPADPGRSRAENNPFTYFQRMRLIDASLRDRGWQPTAFSIVPAPIHEPPRLLAYLPNRRHTVCFITIYDEWGDAKVRKLGALGFRTEVLWRRDMSERVTSGSEVRRAVIAGGEWRHLVPAAVARFLVGEGRGALLASAGAINASAPGCGSYPTISERRR